jgi:hypothetical protein
MTVCPVWFPLANHEANRHRTQLHSSNQPLQAPTNPPSVNHTTDTSVCIDENGHFRRPSAVTIARLQDALASTFRWYFSELFFCVIDFSSIKSQISQSFQSRPQKTAAFYISNLLRGSSTNYPSFSFSVQPSRAHRQWTVGMLNLCQLETSRSVFPKHPRLQEIRSNSPHKRLMTNFGPGSMRSIQAQVSCCSSPSMLHRLTETVRSLENLTEV